MRAWSVTAVRKAVSAGAGGVSRVTATRRRLRVTSATSRTASRGRRPAGSAPAAGRPPPRRADEFELDCRRRWTGGAGRARIRRGIGRCRRPWRGDRCLRPEAAQTSDAQVGRWRRVLRARPADAPRGRTIFMGSSSRTVKRRPAGRGRGWPSYSSPITRSTAPRRSPGSACSSSSSKISAVPPDVRAIIRRRPGPAAVRAADCRPPARTVPRISPPSAARSAAPSRPPTAGRRACRASSRPASVSRTPRPAFSRTAWRRPPSPGWHSCWETADGL